MTKLVEELRHRLVPLGASQLFGLGCGIGGVWASSHWVTPADYGHYGIFVTLAPIGASVVFAGRVKWLSRHWRESSDRAAAWRRATGASTLLVSLVAVASLATTIIFAPDQPLVYGGILFASATLLVFVQLVQSALQAQRSHWLDFGVAATGSATRSFAPPLFYAVGGGGLSALLVGFLVHSAATALAAAGVARRWWGGRTVVAPAGPSAYRGPAFVLLAMAGWVGLGANRWIVGGCFGAESAGLFTLAGAVGGIPAAMLGAVLLQYFQPQWFATGTAESPRLARQVDAVALGYVTASVAVAAALQAGLPWFVAQGFIGERYAAAQPWVLPAGCAAVAAFAGNFYHAMLLAKRRERACVPVDLTGMTLLIGGGVIAALAGERWLRWWLIATPLVPLLINRRLARRALQSAPSSPCESARFS